MQIVAPELGKREIEGLLKRGDAKEVTKRAMLLSGGNSKDGASSKIRNALADTKGKFDDVLVLEASILELSTMFNDFAMVVEEQSVMLDNIEFQTRAAKDYIEDGIDDTMEAVRISKRLRKKRCCVLMISLCAVLGIALFSKGVFN